MTASSPNFGSIPLAPSKRSGRSVGTLHAILMNLLSPNPLRPQSGRNSTGSRRRSQLRKLFHGGLPAVRQPPSPGQIG
jgi:hypothetical protein